MTGIQWWCVTRNGMPLVSVGEDKGKIAKFAEKLLTSDHTAGFEHYPPPLSLSKLKGVKFHVYEKDESSSSLIIWVFACVYDTTQEQAQDFLEMLYLIQQDDENNWFWRRGDTLASQEVFAKWMIRRVKESFHRAKVTMLTQKVDCLKEQMGRNIELLLEREGKLEDLDTKAKDATEACAVIKKRAKKLKKKVRRAQMWQIAKYGTVVGTTVTVVAVGVAVPLIVLA